MRMNDNLVYSAKPVTLSKSKLFAVVFCPFHFGSKLSAFLVIFLMFWLVILFFFSVHV